METTENNQTTNTEIEIAERYSETANTRWDLSPVEGVLYVWTHYHEVNKSTLNDVLHSTFRAAFDRFVEDWIENPSVEFKRYITLPDGTQ